MSINNKIMDSSYQSYFSGEEIVISKKDYYTDLYGYPNQAAFEDFAKNLYENEKEGTEDSFYLICLNINLRKSNKISVAIGDHVMKKFFVDIQSNFDEAYIFRIQGEKFNVLIRDIDYYHLKEFLDKPNDAYEIYYGCTKEKYIYTRNDELIQKNICLMYQNKIEKKRQKKFKTHVENAKTDNIPAEFKETQTRKYISTMWYATAKVTVLEPIVKDFTLYIYPTKLTEPLASIPLAVVLDDFLSYRCYYGTNIKFGVETIMFAVNARFSRDGHLLVSVYSTDEEVECEFDIDTSEGKYLPSAFGKQLDNGRELYPLKKNIHGYFDFIILNPDNSIEINKSGIVTTNGKSYGVIKDQKCIDLIQQ